MKRISFCLLMLCALCATYSFAQSTGDRIKVKHNSVKMVFTVTSSAKFTVKLSEVPSSLAYLIVPDKILYKGCQYTVTGIGNNGKSICEEKQKITTAGIMLGVLAGPARTKIVESKLRRLEIPSSITYIEEYAFANCSSLAEVEFPSTHISIGGMAFYGCSLLTSDSKFIAELNRVNGNSGQQQASQSAARPNPVAQAPQPQPQPQPAAEAPKAPSSDVDINIPQTNNTYESMFAFIIANENYASVSKVQYAINDGKTMAKYCQQTLGIPESNIKTFYDATLNNINGAIRTMEQIANVYNGSASFIIYYAGHGVPNEVDGSSFLLPVDGDGSDPETGYSLKKFYDHISKMPANNVVVLMDACFSGAQRGNGMLVSARGVAIKAKAETPRGNMVVISAAQGDETAYPYQEKEHGLFTYFLLKKLQQDKGATSLGDLSEYITQQVSRRSIVTNNKSQTPCTQASPELGSAWKEWKLK